MKKLLLFLFMVCVLGSFVLGDPCSYHADGNTVSWTNHVFNSKPCSDPRHNECIGVLMACPSGYHSTLNNCYNPGTRCGNFVCNVGSDSRCYIHCCEKDTSSPPPPTPTNGYCTDWSDWSDCDGDCITSTRGEQTRTRSYIPPTGGGNHHSCRFDLEESQSCRTVCYLCGGTRPLFGIFGPTRYPSGYTPTEWTYDESVTSSTHCLFKCLEGYVLIDGTCKLPPVQCGETHYNCISGRRYGFNYDTLTHWNWNCIQFGIDSLISCSELKPVQGSCGTTQGACNLGNPINENLISNGYSWTCEGINGGDNDSCMVCDECYVESEGLCIVDSCASCGTGSMVCSDLGVCQDAIEVCHAPLLNIYNDEDCDGTTDYDNQDGKPADQDCLFGISNIRITGGFAP
jgi:hypothetical protein